MGWNEKGPVDPALFRIVCLLPVGLADFMEGTLRGSGASVNRESGGGGR